MQTNQPIQNPTPQTPNTQPVNPTSPPTTDPSPQPKTPKKKFPKWLIILIIFLLLGATGIFAYQNYQLKQKMVDRQPTPSPQNLISSPSLISSTPTDESNTDLKAYTSQDNFVEFQYPEELSSLINSKQFSLSSKTKQEIVDNYEKYKESGCPSNCGILTDDPTLLQKQFDILTKISNSSTCTISTDDKKAIEKDFILFTGGIGSKKQIEGIKTKNGQCGLKFIESDGFDVSINNYYYKVGFIKDNKIIDIRFNIFPNNSFKSVDNLWSNIGYDSTTRSCDATCYEKEADYFEKFNIENKIEKEVIQAYDQIISTIELN